MGGIDLSGGSCRDLLPGDTQDIFFPEVGRPSKNPKWKKYCDICQVKLDCLKYGVVHDEFGVWGGTIRSERRFLPDVVRESYVAEAQRDGWYNPPLSAADVFPRLAQLEAYIQEFPSNPESLDTEDQTNTQNQLPPQEPFDSTLSVFSFVREVQEKMRENFLSQIEVLESALQGGEDFELPRVKLQSVFATGKPLIPSAPVEALKGSSVFQQPFQVP